MYISVPRIKENAKPLGLTQNEELHRVIFHGILHLCGYEDKTNDQKKLMRLKEDYYIKKYNLNIKVFHKTQFL